MENIIDQIRIISSRLEDVHSAAGKKGRPEWGKLYNIKYKIIRMMLTSSDSDPQRIRWSRYYDKTELDSLSGQFFSSVLITHDFFLMVGSHPPKADLSQIYKYFTSEVGVPFNPGPESLISWSCITGLTIFNLRKEACSLKDCIPGKEYNRMD